MIFVINIFENVLFVIGWESQQWGIKLILKCWGEFMTRVLSTLLFTLLKNYDEFIVQMTIADYTLFIVFRSYLKILNVIITGKFCCKNGNFRGFLFFSDKWVNNSLCWFWCRNHTQKSLFIYLVWKWECSIWPMLEKQLE